jgi:hypothetical protein
MKQRQQERMKTVNSGEIWDNFNEEKTKRMPCWNDNFRSR